MKIIPLLFVSIVYFFSSACEELKKIVGKRVFFDTTFVVNNYNFRLNYFELSDRYWTVTLFRDNKQMWTDTLPLENIVNIELSDLNSDGDNDVLFQSGRIIPVYTLYLFNTSTGIFQRVEGFDKYHGIVRIDDNDSCFFSYDKIGCDNLVWTSSLFYIHGYKTIPIAKMYGNSCDSLYDETKRLIQVFKVQELGNILVKQIPYSNVIKGNEQKFEFLKQYWNQHLLFFLKSEN